MVEADVAARVGRTLQLPSRYICFGPFQVDLELQIVTGNGSRLKVRGKAYQILLALAEKQGGLVTRKELRVRLWSAASHLNYDAKINAAVNKLRKALRDPSNQSLYVETVPHIGYRLAPQSELADFPVVAASESSDGPTRNTHPTGRYFCPSNIWITVKAISVIAAGILLGATIVRLWIAHFASVSIK